MCSVGIANNKNKTIQSTRTAWEETLNDSLVDNFDPLQYSEPDLVVGGFEARIRLVDL